MTTSCVSSRESVDTGAIILQRWNRPAILLRLNEEESLAWLASKRQARGPQAAEPPVLIPALKRSTSASTYEARSVRSGPST